jgi:hypothetical protein
MELITLIGQLLLACFLYALLYGITKFSIEDDADCRSLGAFDEFKLRNILLMPWFITLISYFLNPDVPVGHRVLLFLGLYVLSFFLAKFLFASHGTVTKSNSRLLTLFVGSGFQMLLIGGVLLGVNWFAMF